MDSRDQLAARAARRPADRRTLILIPIIHTEADMGALSEPIQRMKATKLGEESLERNAEMVNQLWTQIEQTLEGLAISYERVRVYQDGLPVCGRELEIVNELATAGSRNHQLLLKLKAKGATIMGSESSEFLVEEYQLLQWVNNPIFRPDKQAEIAPGSLAGIEERMSRLEASLSKVPVPAS